MSHWCPVCRGDITMRDVIKQANHRPPVWWRSKAEWRFAASVDPELEAAIRELYNDCRK